MFGWWGIGDCIATPLGGIYVVCNIDNSCTVWDFRVYAGARNDQINSEKIIGHSGGIEHLQKNELITLNP